MRNLKRLAMVLAIGPVITPMRSLTHGLILACLLIVQPVSANPGTTQAVLDHHRAAINAGDIDAIMADYHANAVLILGGSAVFEGEDAIRAFFEGVLAACGTINLVAFDTVVIDQIAYWQWTWPGVVSYGTTTFLIKGGQIRVQTDGLVPISPSCLFP